MIEGRGWVLKVGAAEHFRPYLTTLAFRIEAGGRSLVYSGDSGPTPPMRAFAEGADVLIHMCHYRSGTALSEGFADSCMGHMELAQLAADANVRGVVTTHITEQFDKPGARERVIAEMGSVYRGNIFFGEDLMEIPVGALLLNKLN